MIFINSTGIGSWHFQDKRHSWLISVINQIHRRTLEQSEELLASTNSTNFKLAGGGTSDHFNNNLRVASFWSFDCNNENQKCFSDHWGSSWNVKN